MTLSGSVSLSPEVTDEGLDIPSLLKGEILLNPKPYTNWGGAVTAQMFLPMQRAKVWQQLVDYPRWVQYFPDMNRSEVLSELIAVKSDPKQRKLLYQAASKAFLFLVAQVEIYLNVVETAHQRIQFYLESGSFHDFSADLRLKDFNNGTLLIYSVQATPKIPVPGLFIQQAMQLDLPANLRNMRQILCRSL